jgi:uncharacterized membrane protein
MNEENPKRCSVRVLDIELPPPFGIHPSSFHLLPLSTFGLRFSDFWFKLRATDMGSTLPSDRAPAELAPSTRLRDQSVHVICALALVSFLLVLWTLIAGTPLPGKPGWPEALLILLTTIATLASLSRTLPGPNLLLATVIIGFLGGLAHGLGAKTAIPFGPFVYGESAGPQFFNVLAWPMPLIWIIAVLNSRGVAKLILRPWRKLRSYGFWLIGLTTGFVGLFDLALEPFAAHTNHFWRWLPTKVPFTWYGAPLVNFLGWLIITLIILAFTTPALSKKASPSKRNPVDYHPLLVWLLVLTLFATSAFRNQLWPAAGLCVLTGIAAAVLAVRGARW